MLDNADLVGGYSPPIQRGSKHRSGVLGDRDQQPA